MSDHAQPTNPSEPGSESAPQPAAEPGPPAEHADPGHEQPTAGYSVAPEYPAATYDTTPYNAESYGAGPAYGDPTYGGAAYGDPTYASADSPNPTYGNPTEGIPPYGQAPYPTAPYGEQVYASSYQPAQPAPAPRARQGRTILLAAAVAAVVGGAIGAGTVAVLDSRTTSSSGLTVSTASAPASAKIDGSVVAAAARVQPSVVTINVAGASESGTGSGVVLRKDGYILTNNHVVAVAGNGGQIQVITNGGKPATASVVGIDASDDLAVIKVTGGLDLPPVTFGRSSTLKVGQTVVAIGAPLGLSNTVTSGIVSNTARPVETGDSNSANAVFDAIQTDAAINPGNSGGPLIDLNGNVVGINAAIASADSGGLQVPGQTAQSGSIGIGFAIPSDEASRIASELITNGKATHAVIGVTVESSQSQTSITAKIGATIAAVTANSPAAKAGLRPGDVVTKVNSQLIEQDVDLAAAIRSYAPGQTVSLTYTRAGVSQSLQIKLGTAAS